MTLPLESHTEWWAQLQREGAYRLELRDRLLIAKGAIDTRDESVCDALEGLFLDAPAGRVLSRVTARVDHSRSHHRLNWRAEWICQGDANARMGARQTRINPAE